MAEQEMPVLDKPEELGKTIAAAVRYAKRSLKDFASEIGATEPTLRDYIRGKLGIYTKTRELRIALAREVQKKSGCPEAWFELNVLVPGEADQLRKEFETDLDAAKTELRSERAEELDALEERLRTLEHAVTTAK